MKHILISVIAAMLCVISACARPPAKPSLTAVATEDLEPITVAASCLGSFSHGNSWYLSVNSARQAELTIVTHKDIVSRFEISGQQWADFRNALEKEAFFDLADDFGMPVVDGSTRTLTVTVGDKSKTIHIEYLHSEHAPADQLREMARMLRIVMMVRGWITDPEAVDLLTYDRMIIKKAEVLQ
jgi:hypothetical protein